MKDINQPNKRIILHSDVNNFFASVECCKKPELKDKPVAVAGNPLKRTGIILAKNEVAKKYGVQTGQTIGEALAVCPNLVCLPPHYDIYEEISEKLHELYLEYTYLVEPLGLDECWLDVTGCEKYLGKTGKGIADEIRQRVKKEFGFTVSVGVSFSKIFAKLGSDMRKPDFTTIISYEDFKEITYNLPLNSIVGIGRRLTRKFFSIDVKTIGDFVNLEDNYLNEIMGIVGIRLKQDLLGQREDSVSNFYQIPPPKSIGNGTTTTKDIVTRKDIEKTFFFLSQRISERMIRHKVVASTLSVSLKNKDLKSVHKAMKIPQTNSVSDLSKYAMIIVDKIWKYNYPVRAIRLRASNLSSSNIKQLSMFDIQKDYSSAVEEINKKYGKIELASNKTSFLNPPASWINKNSQGQP